MARKTIFVSDFSQKEIPDDKQSVQVVLRYADARRGLIVADNVLWSGRVLKPEDPDDHAIVAFNEKIHRDTRVECVMLPIRDGVSLIRKR